MTRPKTVYDLMCEVACHLAQKQLQLRFQHNEGFKGLCRTDNSGLTVIDMDPDLQFWDEKEFLRVFLHEVSHALNHKFIPLDLQVSSKLEVIEDKVYNKREAQADKQASTWLKYAEQNRKAELPYFEGCLWTLLAYQVTKGFY